MVRTMLWAMKSSSEQLASYAICCSIGSGVGLLSSRRPLRTKGARSPAGRCAAGSTNRLPLAMAMAINPSISSLASATGMNSVEPGAFAIHRFGGSMCGGSAGRSSRSSDKRVVHSSQTARIVSMVLSPSRRSRSAPGVWSRVSVR